MIIALTGATGDVGYEACRQLALRSEVSQLVLTCRSKPQAEAVVKQLVSDTGKPASFFKYVIINFRDLNGILAAVSSFPKLDVLCLNAGGFGRNTVHKASGTTDAFIDNVLGSSVLSDNLVKFGKMKNGAKIVYVGSEVTRGLWSFRGLLPVYWGFGPEDVEWAMTTNYDADPCACIPVRKQLGDYKNAKILGHAFYAAIAEELPAIHTVIVSPGAIGGSFAERGFCPIGQLMQYAPWIVRQLESSP